MALTRQDVLAAAVAILDEYGLADLSMRRLGDALGVRAGALYHHVPNKQTLLAWIADGVLASVPRPAAPWRPGLAAWAADLRAALLAHRDSAELVASARAMGLAENDAAADAAALLGAAGLPAPDAAAAASTLVHFVLGHVVQEQARLEWERFGKPDPDRAPTATQASFTLGVGLILDGIAAHLPR
nr:TetR family transcriptional regulator [Propionibacterium sp.]